MAIFSVFAVSVAIVWGMIFGTRLRDRPQWVMIGAPPTAIAIFAMLAWLWAISLGLAH